MVQEVSPWPLIAQVRFSSQANACGIYGAQSGIGVGVIFFEYSGFSPTRKTQPMLYNN